MAISTGGITEEWGEPKQCLIRLMRLVRDFAPRHEDDYFVDIAFRSWHNFREPEFLGVRPDMVGRKQRRFIVWHSVPQGLATDTDAQHWLASVLPETARLCREHLPTKSRAYPAEELAREVEALAAHLTDLS
ncbi:MAG: hypothetical protein JWM40_778 [Frankiales bacterium]|nr:hypothetical protein [Frankiales bacterium]